jgi:hypothetical protein
MHLAVTKDQQWTIYVVRSDHGLRLGRIVNAKGRIIPIGFHDAESSVFEAKSMLFCMG